MGIRQVVDMRFVAIWFLDFADRDPDVSYFNHRMSSEPDYTENRDGVRLSCDS